MRLDHAAHALGLRVIPIGTDAAKPILHLGYMRLDDGDQPRAFILVAGRAADIDAGASGRVDRVALAIKNTGRDRDCLALLRDRGRLDKEHRTGSHTPPIAEIALARIA